jgi:RHH-type rel operon transcriptional repressor/antitoxin RelB
MLSIRLSPEVEQRLETLAKETHRPKSFYVREALERSLEDIEDIYLAEKRLEDLRAGKSQAHSLADVERDLGLAD